MNDLISIIIPIFKVEKYLRKCIDSIINQTYRNLEIILVDDGSPDKCPDICDEYAKLDSRIKVIHKKNGGLSSARNAGLDIATGEYIAFVDSDDFVDYDMYENMLYRIKKENADIAICNFDNVDEYLCSIDELNSISPIKDNIYNKLQLFEYLGQPNYWYWVVAWNKLYKKDIFKELRFKSNVLHEDEFIIHHLLGKINKIVGTEKRHYHYLRRKDSIIGNNESRESIINTIEAFIDRLNYCVDNGIYNIIEITEIRIWLIIMSKKELLLDRELIRKYRLCCFKIWRYIPFRKKVKWIYLIFPRLIKIIHK